MTPTGPLITDFDNSNRFLAGPGDCPVNHRALVITIRSAGSRYWMQASGPALRLANGIPPTCELNADADTIRIWRRNLRRTWEEEVVQLRAPGGRRGVWHPVAERLDLRTLDDQSQVDAMWRSLAQAGHELFVLLFEQGDDRLRTFGRQVAAAIRAQPLTITVHSDDLVLPWPMLYTPPDPAQRIEASGPVDLQGFWGYRHIIEHTFTLPGAYADAIAVPGRVQAGGYIDKRIDELNGKPRTVRPVVRYLSHQTDLLEATTQDELRDHLNKRGRDDHLLYFCCHCEDDDGDALMRLSDGRSVNGGKIDSWLADGDLRHNPLVFVNACNAAVLPSNTRTHFGSVLLRKGAGGLIGPNVSVPQRFAMTYATALLRRMLRQGQQLGPVVRDLAAHFAERRRNPLGLAYSAYQCVDTHFCRHTERHQ